ncbi:MAG: repair protein recO [Firmicutes bacterium]|nr:repair protein recO [Bacillota bacterium]
MAQYSTEAILLAVRNWGEADKMVTFFSRELGKITAVAYGCRRPKSPLAGGMQAFSHLELGVMAGTHLDTIKQCETITSFKNLRENLDAMAYASFLTELVVEVCPERHPEPHIYDLLVCALRMLSKRNPRLVALAAAYQLVEYTGYQPVYTVCVACGQNIETDAFFSFEKGGVICNQCSSPGMIDMPLKMQGFIQNLLQLDWEKPKKFSINGAILVQTEKLLLDYLVFFIEKPLKSLAFIKQLAVLKS